MFLNQIIDWNLSTMCANIMNIVWPLNAGIYPGLNEKEFDNVLLFVNFICLQTMFLLRQIFHFKYRLVYSPVCAIGCLSLARFLSLRSLVCHSARLFNSPQICRWNIDRTELKCGGQTPFETSQAWSRTAEFPQFPVLSLIKQFPHYCRKTNMALISIFNKPITAEMYKNLNDMCPVYSSFLHGNPRISPWLKSISGELEINFYVLAWHRRSHITYITINCYDITRR